MHRHLIVAGAVATLGWGGAALAQSGECACTTPMAIGTVGQISAIHGELLASREEGFGPVEEGSSIPAGSRLIAGPGSSASIDIGSCAVAVAPNSEVTIARAGSDICVRVNEVDVMYTGQIPAANNIPLLIFGGFAAGSAVGAAVGGGDDQASR